MSDLKIKLFSILNSIGPSMSAQQSEDISEAFNELDRLRAEVASLKEEREVLIDSSNRFSNAQLAAIKQWNLAGEQLFLADETLRSISSYVGQGRMDGVENLDYEDVEKRIKEGIATICQVEESRREALTQQLAAANGRVEQFAWATFDGEGSYDLRLYQDNENYRDEYIRINGEKYASWVIPLYVATPEADKEKS